MAKLTLIRGIPGAGKSTYAKKHFNCIILEQDMFFERNGGYHYNQAKIMDAVKWCIHMAGECLSEGMDVCVVNTLTQKRFIRPYQILAERCGATFEVLRMSNTYGSIHSVPDAVVGRMKAQFEDWPGEQMVS